ncbi:hypothetical protein [Streptomyces sp. WZ.A104]|uniref:hypothetical protein n=1 Tax=Streptomyces sp. WZ.A104 TaxID=2023771 RepID=UPI00211C01ED|nr:hypothetical protein [Streptomyces sp. WZ.A104]
MTVRTPERGGAFRFGREVGLTGRTGGFGRPMIQRLAQEVRVREAAGGGLREGHPRHLAALRRREGAPPSRSDGRAVDGGR